MSRNVDIQKAFRVLAEEADRVLPQGSLEQTVMKGQLNWMRVLLIEHEGLLAAEDELVATMRAHVTTRKPIHKRGQPRRIYKPSTLEILAKVQAK